MKYVVSLNGSFEDVCNYKQAAINKAKEIYNKLSDEDKKYSFVTVDECAEVVYYQYEVDCYDDEYLQENSTLILEI